MESVAAVDLVLPEIVLRLVSALLLGAAIGFERSYRGRPAGFRTHALVCLSTSLLMLLTAYEGLWVPESSDMRVTLDPTRMAQGIMTGIGFIGAGAIMKDGLSVRGLTTAASIWITAAIGILIGVGFYVPAAISAALTLATLSAFGWLERKLPAEFYALFTVRFERSAQVDEQELRRLVMSRGFSIANLHYRFDAPKQYFEYRMVLKSTNPRHAQELSVALSERKDVLEFSLAPASD
ncbi:MAG: MgtC/SapB family protein [Planctomycetes bacterium]|nr:MgtC/SapB family protein [Planctomycetota bacterium]